MKEKSFINTIKKPKVILLIVGIVLVISIALLVILNLSNEQELKYNVTFVSNGGSLVETLTVNANNTITKPQDPTRENYKFVGWFYNDELYDFSTPVTGDIELEAIWEAVAAIAKVSNVKLNRTTMILYLGNTSKLVATVTPENASNKNVTWQSSAPDIVSVDANGNIKALKEGNATITVTTEDGGYTAKANILVRLSIVGETVVESDSYQNTTYKVTFKDSDGTKLFDTQTIKYGENATKPANPTKEGHIFLGWYNGITKYSFSSKVKSNLTLTAKWSKIKYTITFVNYDGTILQTKSVAYGTVPTYTKATPTKASTEQYSYTFAGWAPALVAAKENATYTATFTEALNNYEVKFVDEDGSKLVNSQIIEHGSKAIKPDTPTKEGHTFLGWYNKDTEYSFESEVKSNLTLTAKWEKNKYTVTFVNYDGSLLDTQTLEYGTTPSYAGETPVKIQDNTYTYSFNGWDKQLAQVTGDVTYTATFESNYIDYIITFVNDDGTVLSEQTYHYGETITPPANPTKVATEQYSYTFAGWTPQITAVESNKTYTATYTGSLNSYDVTFIDEDGSTLATTQTIEYGSKASAPDEPTKDGHTFLGWYNGNTEYSFESEVKSNLTLTAKWEKNKYTVTFVNYDGSLLDTQTVEYGTTPSYAGENPTKAATEQYSYTFAGWSPEIAVAKEDITYTATFTETLNSYEITFIDEDGSILYTQTVEYGNKITEPNAPTKEGHTFLDWYNKDTEYSFESTVKSNLTLTAKWEKNKYAITFKNYDGSVLDTLTIEYGNKIVEPDSPTKEGHTFLGWYNGDTKYSFESIVKSNLTLTAKMEINKYTITFKNYDGSVLQTKTVEYGTTPTYSGTTPTKFENEKYTYTFSGWTPEIVAAKSEATYTATFTETLNKYTVEFVDENGATLVTAQTIEHGNKAIKPTVPTKEGHTFIAWYNGDTEYSFESEVKSNLTLTAKWKKNKYTITFKNYNGTILDTQTVEYDTTPTYAGPTPTKAKDGVYSYEFDTWSPKLSKVKGDTVYTATFKCYMDIDKELKNATEAIDVKQFNIAKDGNTLNMTFTSYGNNNPPYSFIDIFFEVAEAFHLLSEDDAFESVELYYMHPDSSKGQTIDLKDYDLTDTRYSSWYGNGANDRVGDWLGYLATGTASTTAAFGADSSNLIGKTVKMTYTLKDGYYLEDGSNSVVYYLTFSNE